MYRVLNRELELWNLKWEREKFDISYMCSIKLLQFCDVEIFPTIHGLLRILATLPLSVASAERTFSTLRRIKSWLRSTMSEDRLVGLALMNVHRDIELIVDNIIDRFAKLGNRRLEFEL